MNKLKEDSFLKILRIIHKDSKTTQRVIANNLNFSLGKLNFLLNELKNKGFVKIKNFNAKENKLKSLRYILTPKGLALRTKLLSLFVKRKFNEYEELKNELENKKNK